MTVNALADSATTCIGLKGLPLVDAHAVQSSGAAGQLLCLEGFAMSSSIAKSRHYHQATLLCVVHPIIARSQAADYLRGRK